MQTKIFRAPTIVTLSPDAPPAFASVGERIVAAGSVVDLRARFPAAEVTDFGAAAIVPGFNDAHAHLAVAAEDMRHVDLRSARSARRPNLRQSCGRKPR